jgi:hypothetical protein
VTNLNGNTNVTGDLGVTGTTTTGTLAVILNALRITIRQTFNAADGPEASSSV